MKIISDTTDGNGKRHIVACYTAEEQEAMAERAAAHDAEMERRRSERETSRKAMEAK